MAFLDQSQEEANREEREREEARQREVDQAKALAKARARSVAIFKFACVGVSILAITAVFAMIDARKSRDMANRYLYGAQMNLASKALDEGNLGRAYQLLVKNDSSQGIDHRNWEWYHLWSQCRNDQLKDLGSHEHIARSIAASPTGNYFATGSHDKTIKLINPVTYDEKILTLDTAIHGLDFSPDGKQLAFSGPNLIGIYKTEDLNAQPYIIDRKWGNSIRYSKNGKMLALISENELLIYNTDNYSNISIGTTRGAYGKGVDFSHDNKYVAYRNSNQDSYKPDLFDITTKEKIDLNALDYPENKRSAINSIKFYNKSNLFISTHWNGHISIWDADKRTFVARLDAHNAWVSDVDITADDKNIITASADQSIKIWSTENYSNIAVLSGHKNEVWGVCISSDNKFLYSASKDYTYKLWDATTIDIKSDAFPLQEGENFSLLVNDGKHYITGGKARATVKLTRNMKQVLTYPLTDGDRYGTVSPSLKYTIIVNDSIHLINNQTKEKKLISEIIPREGRVFSELVKFTPDEKSISVIGQNKFYICSIDNGNIEESIPFNGLTGATISDDQTNIILYGWGAPPALYERNGDLISTFVGHQQGAVGAAISWDNSIAATVSFDATTRLWDCETGEELGVLTGQLLSPHSVEFTPDGKRLFVSTGEGSVKLWDVETKSEIMTIDPVGTYADKVNLIEDNSLVVIIGGSLHKLYAPGINYK
jgi:WD40 repeat protein